MKHAGCCPYLGFWPYKEEELTAGAQFLVERTCREHAFPGTAQGKNLVLVRLLAVSLVLWGGLETSTRTGMLTTMLLSA